jgi:hypothetical protein
MVAEGLTRDISKNVMVEGMEKAFRFIKNLIAFVGFTALVIGDVLLGAAVFPHIFAPAGPIMKYVLGWVLSISTSAVEIFLWAWVISRSEGRGFRVFFSSIGKIIGFVFAILISIVDTIFDALYAQIAMYGSTPTVFPPKELAGLSGGFPIFWLVFIMFAIISFFGEPIVLFVIMANKKGV